MKKAAVEALIKLDREGPDKNSRLSPRFLGKAGNDSWGGRSRKNRTTKKTLKIVPASALKMPFAGNLFWILVIEVQNSFPMAQAFCVGAFALGYAGNQLQQIV